MDLGLGDKAIIVTGAASGIGKAVVHALKAEGVGALVLTDRDAAGCAAVSATLGTLDHTMVLADLLDPAAPDQIISQTIARYGRVDGLANCAGLTTRASFLNGTPTLWDQLFAVNARAAFFLMQGAIADMRRRHAPGAIVNILSVNALCGIPELAIYSGSKGALATLTRNAARAHMADHVRVNGINLGWVATETEHRMQSETLGLGSDWQEKAAAQLPLGRLITPEEAARLTVFLLGNASAPMSGSVIDFEQKVAGAM